MSFKSTLNLDSKFFDPTERQKSFGSAAYESAQEFRADLKQKMEDSTPTGNIVSIGRGTGFETRFQRSRRGQRPAIQTRKLISSIHSKRISESSAETSVDALDDDGANIGERLQNDYGRLVMTPEDILAADANFQRKLQQKLIDLI